MARPPGTDEREIRRGAWRREQIDAAAVGGIGAALVSPLVNLGGETTALPLAIVMVAVAAVALGAYVIGRAGPSYHETGNATSPCDNEWKPADRVDGSTVSCMFGNRGMS